MHGLITDFSDYVIVPENILLDWFEFDDNSSPGSEYVLQPSYAAKEGAYSSLLKQELQLTWVQSLPNLSGNDL